MFIKGEQSITDDSYIDDTLEGIETNNSNSHNNSHKNPTSPPPTTTTYKTNTSTSTTTNTNDYQSIKYKRFEAATAVCTIVLELSVKHLKHLNLLEGPVRMLRYLTNYWMISHKIQLWTNQSVTPDSSLISGYEHLLSFYSDSNSYCYQFR